MAEGTCGLRVEVVYADTDSVWWRAVHLASGSTVADAIAGSGFAAARPDVRVADDCLGVFGHRVKPDRPLRDGDRVEIYRPLLLDPMEARRRRARAKD